MTSRAAFEIAIGAILTQNTTWKNVEHALSALKRERALTPHRIVGLSRKRLETLLRPSGYFHQKARRVRAFVLWVLSLEGGLLAWLKRTPAAQARSVLLALHGIGPETADSILLYAGGKPVFVVDTYTKRFCASQGTVHKTYEEYQRFFMSRLPRSTKFYQEYHALIVRWGKGSRE